MVYFVYELPPLTGEGLWQLILISPALIGLSLGYVFLSPKRQKYISGVISIILGLGITLLSTLGGPGLAGLTAFLPLIFLIALGAYLYNIPKKGLSALVVIAGVLVSFSLFTWMLWSGYIL